MASATEFRKVETWKLRGTLPLQCATCQAAGVELRTDVVVELHASPRVPPEDEGTINFVLAIRILDGDRPVEVECLSCGAVVRYGDAAGVTADED